MRSERLLLFTLCVLSGLVLLLLVSPPHTQLTPPFFHSHLAPDAADFGLDEHSRGPDTHRLRRTEYPPRKNMSACQPRFGKVGIFVAYVKSSMETHYAVAQRSLECYLRTTNYTVFMVDLDNDPRVNHACYNNKQLFFRKHCAASVYLLEVDWMLILDADTGIVNPNHCIEEWIDDRVDLIFYERFFNWEIASGNYIARNTDFSKNFLKKWADWEFIQPSNWNGADNGVLQMHILQTVLPSAMQEIKVCDQIWHEGTDYDTYMAYVTCIKVSLGSTRLWPGKLRIYRRAHGWVRDGFLSSDQWSPIDFMFHGWKAQTVNQSGWISPFNKNLDPSLCGKGEEGWDWRPEKRVSVETVKKQLAAFEKSTGTNYPKKGRVHPYLKYPDVASCYPNCDDLV